MVACATPECRKGFSPSWWKTPSGGPDKFSWEVLPPEANKCEVVLSKRNELGLLSNFAPTPITFHGYHYASIEALWQVMLYPTGPLDRRAVAAKKKGLKYRFSRQQVAEMVGFEAKGAGEEAEDIMKQIGVDWVSYDGQVMPYRSKKPGKHYDLIVEALWAKVRQNPKVKDVLMSTGNLTLIPDHIMESDAPPEWHYNEIWMTIRDQIRREQVQSIEN